MCSHTFDTSINGVPRIVKEWHDNEYRDLPTHLISRGALIIRKMCLLLTVVSVLKKPMSFKYLAYTSSFLLNKFEITLR